MEAITDGQVIVSQSISDEIVIDVFIIMVFFLRKKCLLVRTAPIVLAIYLINCCIRSLRCAFNNNVTILPFIFDYAWAKSIMQALSVVSIEIK